MCRLRTFRFPVSIARNGQPPRILGFGASALVQVDEVLHAMSAFNAFCSTVSQEVLTAIYNRLADNG